MAQGDPHAAGGDDWPPLLDAALGAEEVAQLLEELGRALGERFGIQEVRLRPAREPGDGAEDGGEGWRLRLPVLLGTLEVVRKEPPDARTENELRAATREAAASLGARLAETLLAHGAQALQLLTGGNEEFFYYVHDAAGVFTYVSPSVQAITGRKPEEWKRHYSAYFTENPINALAARHTQWTLQDGSGAPSYLVEIVHADGHPVLLRIHERPLRRGDRILGIHGIAVDVTRWYSAERELLDTEQRYRILFEQAREGVLVADATGRILQANPAACQLLDRSQEELRRAVLDRILPLEVAGQALAVARSPDDRALEWRVQELPDHRRLVFLRDVSEEVRAEQERRALEQQLVAAQRFESMGRLAGGVAHDLNNILTAIQAHAELLAAESQEPRADVTGILEAVEEASRLTKRLLEFSRRRPRKPVELDLCALVEGLLPTLRTLAGRGVRLETSLDPAAPRIQAEPTELEQVLMNLVVNARDALEGRGRVEIRVQPCLVEPGDPRWPTVPPGTAALLTVADDGPGIPAAIREHIFEPFFSTKDRERGSGLGLSIVQSLAIRNGGAVRVRSREGAGAAFEVLLPGLVRELPGPAPGERGIVLIVDDEEPVLLLVRRILERDGYRILAARDGAEARASLEAHGPVDLLLADVVLARETGMEVARDLRRMQPGLPVLFISGHLGPGPDREVAREMEDLGARFLAKPFGRKALLAAVAAALGKTVTHPGPGAGR